MSDRLYVGGCGCGAVSFEFAGPADGVYHCHCTRCRGLHSAGYVTWAALPHRRFRLLSPADGLRFYASSEREHRAFCRVCGSHVFAEAIEPAARADIYVPLAAVHEPHDLEPTHHIHADSHARWIPRDESLPVYRGDGPE